MAHRSHAEWPWPRELGLVGSLHPWHPSATRRRPRGIVSGRGMRRGEKMLPILLEVPAWNLRIHSYGVMILLPCDVAVDRGSFSWTWDIPEPLTSGHPRAPLSFHVAAQFADTPLANGGATYRRSNVIKSIFVKPKREARTTISSTTYRAPCSADRALTKVTWFRRDGESPTLP